MAGATFSQRPSYDLFRDAERGMARALGMGEPTPSTIQSLVMRPLMWLASRSEVQITVNDDGVTVNQGGSRKAYAWADIAMSFETDNQVGLVLASTTAPVTLNKRAMSAGDLAEVRRLVAANVQSTSDAVEQIRSTRAE